MDNETDKSKGTEVLNPNAGMEKFLMSHRFLTLGAEYLRGEIPDLEHAQQAGYSSENWKSNSDYLPEAKKYAEAYKAWSALGSITQEEVYDFALLEPLVGPHNISSSEESSALSSEIYFLGHRYKKALGHALVWEYIHFESPNIFLDNQNTDLDLSVRSSYIEAISKLKKGEDFEESMNMAVDNVIQIKRNLKRIGPGSKPEPWDQATELYLNISESLNNHSTSGVINSIDRINSASHNNGNLIERMIDQSNENRDTLALIELDMKRNWNTLYSHATPEAKSIFKSMGGNYYLIENNATDYNAQFIEAFESFLRRGTQVDNMQQYITDVIYQTGVEMGLNNPVLYSKLIPQLQELIEMYLPESLKKSQRLDYFVEADREAFIAGAIKKLSDGFEKGKEFNSR